MCAVIFKAIINKLDKSYYEMAVRMRELEIDKYGCSEFISVSEGGQEISISYWRNLNSITEWKQNSEHLVAQELGVSVWYKANTLGRFARSCFYGAEVGRYAYCQEKLLKSGERNVSIHYCLSGRR